MSHLQDIMGFKEDKMVIQITLNRFPLREQQMMYDTCATIEQILHWLENISSLKSHA